MSADWPIREVQLSSVANRRGKEAGRWEFCVLKEKEKFPET